MEDIYGELLLKNECLKNPFENGWCAKEILLSA
jgi:hypothetical protein